MKNAEEAGVSLVAPSATLPKVKLGQSFVVTRLGLVADGHPTQDEWFNISALLNKASDSIHWWIGDWLLLGIENYGLSYEKAQEYLEQRGLEYQDGTLMDDKYVASRLPFSCRHEKLSFKHHREVAPLPPDKQEFWLSYAEEHGTSATELRALIHGAPKLTWLRYTDVWNFSECDNRYGIDYDGRIPGQIIQNILFYYTKPKDLIIDPMAGGGTTLDVCTKCDEVKRDCLAFDKKSIREDIKQADATQSWPTKKQANLIFIDPPYASQQKDAYGISVPDFFKLMADTLKQALSYLKDDGILAVLIAPMAIQTEYTDLPFLLYEMAINSGYKLTRRIFVPVGSQQVGAVITKDCKDNKRMIALTRDLLIFRKLV